jgi:two-component system cell cycle sensor histidine kinase/response regulator CckA
MQNNRGKKRVKKSSEQSSKSNGPAWFDSFPEPVFIMDPEGTILDANDAFAARFQKLPQECLGANVYRFLEPESASERMKMASEVLRTAKQLSWEDERNSRIIRNTIYPTLTDEGKVKQLLIIAQDITELRSCELTLKNEQAVSKTIINSIPGAFYILDGEGQYVGWNNYLREKIVGKTDREMRSLKAIELIHPDDRKLISEKMLNTLTLGTENIVEGRALLRGGTEFRWFLMTGRRLIINEKPFLVGMGIDITERKQAEKAIEQNEERFRNLFECHSAIQIILDPKTGQIIDANQAAEDFYGWSVKELKQMFIQDINTISSKEVMKILKKWLSAEQLSCSFCHRRADGSIRDVEVFANKVEIKGNALVYCIIHDNNQRKHFEALTAFRLRLLEMASTDSVEELLRATIDEAERLTASAIGFCHLIGISHPQSMVQVMSSNMHKRVHRSTSVETEHPSLNNAEFWSDAIREKRAVINNHYSSIENQNKRPHGHPGVMRTLVVPFLQGENVIAILGVVNKPSDYDEDDVHWVSMLANTAWDIVAKKIADDEREKLQNQLQYFQKMELIGQLAGGIAHDFNNMLGVILGHTELTMDLVDPEQPIHTSLEIIHKAATHSADLTHQLLAFARKQTMISKILNINSIVEEMLPMLRGLVGENIMLHWIPETRLMQVKIDPAQIDQILANLCINARDAITDNGSITIETRMVHVDKIDVTANPPYPIPGDYVTLTVSDNGSGIEKKNLPHIFEPFFTTKEVGKGTGMGLSTVYGIVKQNNGSIECESKAGEGTSFRIFLPRFYEFAVPVESDREPEQEINHSTETILIVEDEPDILKLCALMLERRGYNVLTSDTPGEAIKIAERYPGHINLLLTDVIMPGMKGTELSQKLESTYPDLKTLFMSGYTTDIAFHHKMPHDGVNFIQKPFSVNTLIKAVHESLHD